MDVSEKREEWTGRSLAWDSRGRLECRRCGVVCERVVSPWRCLKSRYTCVYAYEEGDCTYFGCVHKVFSPELDLAAFADDGDRQDTRADPYGSLRVVRVPRPQCPVGVERAYSADPGLEACTNPGFLRGEDTRPGSCGNGSRGAGPICYRGPRS
jgi:hypothetical protein